MDWLRRFLDAAKRSAALPPARTSSTRHITFSDPLVIQAPRLGLLNLLGASAQDIMEEDKKAIGALFVSVQQSDSEPPVCDLLLIYARVQSDGSITGSADGLRTLIRKSKAPIVIIASENSANSYLAAGKRTGNDPANLVMTLKRKGPLFGHFFSQLFRKMYEGKSMPTAWVELVPQHAEAPQHNNCPETIFSAEVSHITFKAVTIHDLRGVLSTG